MDDCTPSDPCKETGCPFCYDYVEAYEQGSRLLDTLTERGRRTGRQEASTYDRSELSAIAPPSWLVRGVATRASLTLLAGKFGTYKSFVSMSLAGSVATGTPFLGHPVDEVGPVIYIAAEGLSGVRGRIEAWEAAHNGGQMVPDGMFTVIGTSVDLRSAEDMTILDRTCRRVRPRLIIWDTLHRCAPGVDENSNTEMGVIIDRLSWIRETHDCTQLVNHHTGHGGTRSRGASALEDDFDNSWVITLAGEGEDRSAANQRTMEHRKVKDGELSGKIPIGLTPVLDSAYVENKLVAGDQAGQGWLVVKAVAGKFDIAGVPLSWGKDRLRGALPAIGVTGLDNNTLTAIATLRKSPSYVPSTKPSADGY